MAIFLVVLGHALCGMNHAKIPVPPGSDYAWTGCTRSTCRCFFSCRAFLSCRRYGRAWTALSSTAWATCYTVMCSGPCSTPSFAARSETTRTSNPIGPCWRSSWRVPIGELWFLYVLFLYYAVYVVLYAMKFPSWSALLLGIACLAVWQWQMIHVNGWNVLEGRCNSSLLLRSRWLCRPVPLGPLPQRKLVRLSPAAVCFALFSWSIYCKAFAGPLKTPVALLGILGTVLAANVLAQRSWCRFVRSMGVATLAIYLAHTCFTAGWRIVCQKMLHVTHFLSLVPPASSLAGSWRACGCPCCCNRRWTACVSPTFSLSDERQAMIWPLIGYMWMEIHRPF